MREKPPAKPYSPASVSSSIPNLLRDENVVVSAPNQVWQADLTYITFRQAPWGWLYLPGCYLGGFHPQVHRLGFIAKA